MRMGIVVHTVKGMRAPLTVTARVRQIAEVRLESSVGLKRKPDIPDFVVKYMLEFADDFRDAEIKGGMEVVDSEGHKVSFDDIFDHGMEKTKDGKGSGDIELPFAKGGEAESGWKTKGGGSKEDSYTTAKPAGRSAKPPAGWRTKGGAAAKPAGGSAKPPAGWMTKGGATAKRAGVSAKPAAGSKTKVGATANRAGGSKEEGRSTTANPAGVRKRTRMVKHTLDKSFLPYFEMKPIDFSPSCCRDEVFAAALRKYRELEKDILEQFRTKGYAEYEREEEVTDDEGVPISV